MLPKIRKVVERLHLVALLRAGDIAVTMVVAPMNAKFQPTPSSTSPLQKCATVMPAMPTTAVSAISPGQCR